MDFVRIFLQGPLSVLFKYIFLKTTLAIKGDFRDILQGSFKGIVKHIFSRTIESINEELIRTFIELDGLGKITLKILADPIFKNF